MEVSSSMANAAVVTVIAKLSRLIVDKWTKLPEILQSDLEYIKCELRLICAIIEDLKSNGHGTIQEVLIRDYRELAYDLEDCMDRFIVRTSHQQHGSFIHRTLHIAKTEQTRNQFAAEIKILKQRVQEAHQRLGYRQVSSFDPPAAPARSSTSTTPYIAEGDLVGLERKEEILELLAKDQHLNQLRVISIVGFPGLGKTTLARMVYHTHEADSRFWVLASQCRDATELLREICWQVWPKDTGNAASDHDQLIKNLREELNGKRYLIVIDDMQMPAWHSLQYAFPSDDTKGRIIVTTTINSVAEACCSLGGYVYRMQALNERESKSLLEKRVSDQTSALDRVSDSILAKCDGLPLALVEMAQFLRHRSDKQTESDQALSSLKLALTLCYNSLTSTQKACLLSLSIYPKGYTIRRRNLVRRWLAEGFVQSEATRGVELEDAANRYFEELIDRNLIQPVDISYNSEVKTCRVHGVMLDFIVHKSVNENFVTLIHNDNLARDSTTFVRRLSLYKTSARSGRTTMDIDLSRVRSLAILEHPDETIVDFGKCMLLRVLDLENCKGLKDTVLHDICSLLVLKYLSLRGTNVTKITHRISKLQCLETLDIRETKVELLPMEVLILPRLTYLLGRFRLHRDPSRVKTRKLFEQSRLQTLAGVVVEESPDFEHIVDLRELRKIKIWAESTGAYSPQPLESFLRSSSHANALSSLSVNFGNDFERLLQKINAPCSLNSIKLRGRLTRLPDFIRSSVGLRELCLSSTGLDSEQLSTLQSLSQLCYLKVVDLKVVEDFPKFQVQSDGFRSLRCLWIEAQKLPQVSIERGAMPSLRSLQLLCEDVEGLPVDTIMHLRQIREVALGPVSDQTKKAWEDKAKLHPNRPTIKTSAVRRTANVQRCSSSTS